MKKAKGTKNTLRYDKINQRKSRKNTFKKRKSTNDRNNLAPDEDFLGNDYNKVIKHLNKKHFCLNEKNNHSVKSQQTIDIPQTFSISENAEGTIKLLRNIYTLCMNPEIKKIIFNHTNCVELGLSASTIMDIIVLAAEKYRKQLNNPLILEGQLPNNRKTRDILLAGGLPYHLNAYSKMRFDEDHVERFETIKGQHSLDANKADETATKLTLYFDKCLRTQNMELNDEGKRVLSRILGEVISNCEIHGGDSATWYTQGHYRIIGDNLYGEMQLLFLNLGETIYEGLKNPSTSQDTKRKLEYIMSKQKRYINKKWDEEMIYTVFALQEGISRLQDADINGYEGRGSGTVSMIEMFYNIGKSQNGLNPRMSIVSGKTQIRFTNKYKMKTVRFNNDKVFGTGDKRIIAFNDKNDIYYPAKKDSVSKIKYFFPGTVISLKFYLDNRYITNRRKENK